MSEFIGSRISLISKSDIRYVGTLHEINSENSTVALEQVKSYGTEGRRGNPSEELAGSDSIYEYIVFRGSDVKDLRIEEPPKETSPATQVPDDPAILGSGTRPHIPSNQQTTHPPQFQPPPPYGFSQPNGGYPGSRFGGQMNQQNGPSGVPPGGFPNYPPMPYGAPPPGYYVPHGQNMPTAPGPYAHVQQGPYGGSVNPHQFNHMQAQSSAQNQGQSAAAQPAPNTPGPVPSGEIQEKEASGTPSHAIQAQKPAAASTAANKETNIAPRPPNESKPQVEASATLPPDVMPVQGRKKGKIVPAMPLGTPLDKTSTTSDGARTARATSNAAQQYQNATQAATAAVAAAMAKLPPFGGANGTSSQPEIDTNLAKAVNNMRIDNRARGGIQGERGGQFLGHRGGRGGRRGGRDSAKPVEVPTTDFDFETANAKFNKKDLVKEAIATGSPVGTPTNGDGSTEKATDLTKEVIIPTAVPLYDKSSFFDNISSEARDREESGEGIRRPSGNEFRSEERKKNMETFGLGSVDNRFQGGRGRGRGRRGGFRGRGSFRGGRGALDVAQ